MAALKFIVALLFTINAAYALKCYKCDSSDGIGQCNYGFASLTFPSIDCNEGAGVVDGIIPKSCVKVVGKSESGKEYYARGCIPKVGDGLCNAMVKTAGFFSTIDAQEKVDFNCHTCDTDNCNSAMKITTTSVVALLLAVVAFLF